MGLGLGARATRTDLITASESRAGFPEDLTRRATIRPMDNTAFRANPYAGYLWQFAPQWAAGVEGDFGFADSTTTREGFTTISLADSQSRGEKLGDSHEMGRQPAGPARLSRDTADAALRDRRRGLAECSADLELRQSRLRLFSG